MIISKKNLNDYNIKYYNINDYNINDYNIVRSDIRVGEKLAKSWGKVGEKLGELQKAKLR